jgi:hypothetical protein
MCNLGCVAEAAWSTYDLDFVINESLTGMILPMRRRISMRNKEKLSIVRPIEQLPERHKIFDGVVN